MYLLSGMTKARRCLDSWVTKKAKGGKEFGSVRQFSRWWARHVALVWFSALEFLQKQDSPSFLHMSIYCLMNFASNLCNSGLKHFYLQEHMCVAELRPSGWYDDNKIFLQPYGPCWQFIIDIQKFNNASRGSQGMRSLFYFVHTDVTLV